MNKICVDNCGVAAVCQNGNVMGGLCKSLFHLQHRGQCWVGLGVLHHNKAVGGSVAPGLVKHNQHLFQSESGGSAIGHVSLKEPQPYIASGKIGTIGLAFSGNILNARELRQKSILAHHLFTSKDEVEVLTRLVGQRNDPVSGLTYMAEQIKGSFSLVLLTENGAYAARDPYGFKPLVIGKGLTGCAVASESPALTEAGFKLIRDVKPGEIILLGENDISTVGQIQSQGTAHCAFEWAFTARYDSIIEGKAVSQVRNNLGVTLAREDNVQADLVAPIPMSGLGHAEGYHRASGITYGNVFFVNRYSDRSSMPLEQEERDLIAAEKLSPIRNAIEGQRIILCDDSIMSGTQVRHQVARLRAAGAKEIHLRIASPPQMAPCRYGIYTRSHDQLIARRHSVEQIRAMLEADTLKYIDLDGFVAAIGLPRERLCLACFTGEYPP